MNNFGQGTVSNKSFFDADLAQPFTTGNDPNGYKLTSAKFKLETAGGSPTYVVTIRSDSSGNPGNVLGTLTNPAFQTGDAEYSAPGAGIDLVAETRYWLTLDVTGNPASNSSVLGTTSTAEWNGGRLPGWSIGDNRRVRGHSATVWAHDNAVTQIAIVGYSKGNPSPPTWPDDADPPTVSKTDGTTLTVSWDMPATPKPITDYDVRYRRKGDAAWTEHAHTGTGQSATISGLLQGASWEAQVRASNSVGTGPWSATGTGHTGLARVARAYTSTSGSAVFVEFTRDLTNHAFTTAQAAALTLSVDGTNSPKGPIIAHGPGTVGGSRLQVGFQADHRPTAGQSILLSYAKPSTPRLKDADGAAIESFTNQTVENLVGGAPSWAADADPPTVSNDGATLTVTWDEPVSAKAITDYDVRYRRNGDAAWTEHAHTGTSRSATISGVLQGASWEAQVRASNNIGTGPWSATGSSRTGPARVARAYTSTSGSAVFVEFTRDLTNHPFTTAQAAALTLSVDGTNSPKGPIIAHGPGTVGGSRLQVGFQADHRPTAGQSILLSYAKPSTPRLKDADGLAIESFTNQTVENLVGTTASAPSAPSVPSVTNGGTSLAVSWTAPADGGAAINDYDLRYFQGSSDPASDGPWIESGESGGHDHVGTATSATIAGVVNRAEYRVQVRGTNSAGTGPWSESGVSKTHQIKNVVIASYPSLDSDNDGLADTYVRQDKILVDVDFGADTPIVIGGDKDLRLRLDIGDDDTNLGNSRKVVSTYELLRGGEVLRFSYAIQAADTDSDGVWVQTGGTNHVVSTPGTATITHAVTGDAVDRTFTGLPTTGNPRARVDGSKSATDIGPKATSAEINGETLTVTFSRNLDTSVDTTALVRDLLVAGVGVHNYDGGAEHPKSVSVSTNKLTLTLNHPARAADRVFVGYNGTILRGDGSNGKQVPMFRDLAVTNNTAGTAGPALTSASVAGNKLQLLFDAALDNTSKPAGSAFYVRAGDADDDGRGIAGTGTVGISGTKVTVTLTHAVDADESANVSYKKPTANPLRAAASGNAAVESFERFPVRLVADAAAPVLRGGAVVQTGTSTATMTLYFDEPLDTGSKPATGDLVVAKNNSRVTVSSVTVKGSNLVLKLGDSAATGTTFSVDYTPGTNPIRDLAENATAAFRQTLTATAAGKPARTGVSVDGTRVTISYDKALDPESTPAGDAFTLYEPIGPSGDRLELRMNVLSVGIEGKNAVLRLSDTVYPCAGTTPFTLSYTKPGTRPLQGLDGTDVDAIAAGDNLSVRNARAGWCGIGWFDYARTGSVILRATRPLATDRPLDPAWFTVTASRGPATVTAVAYSTTDSHELKLSMSREFEHGEDITVTYRRPEGTSGLWDTEGKQLADIVNEPVTNNVQAATPPTVDRGAVDGTELTLVFSEEVTSTNTTDLNLAFFVTGTRVDQHPQSATIDENIVRLTLGTAAVAGEQVAVNYDTDMAANARLRGLDGEHVGSFKGQALENLTGTGQTINMPADGTLAIEGTARVGETLTAVTDGIRDTDGMSGAEFTYQWLTVAGSAESEIDGATSRTLLLDETHEGSQVKVHATFTDDGGHEETMISAATEAVAPAPRLTAEFRDVPAEHGGRGSEFSFELRFSENFPGRFDYRILRDEALQATNARVTGAKRVARGQNRRWIITVRPRSSDDVTVSLPATTDCSAAGAVCTEAGRPLSNANSATVRGGSNQPATGAPTIAGTAQAGETLTASTTDIEDADGLSGATFSYQWLAGDADIAGATEASLTLGDAQVGSTVQVRVTFTDDAGNEESLTSSATAAVAARPLTAEFRDVPAEHDGESAFEFELRFSENFPGRLRYKMLRDEALRTTNGQVTGARRAAQGQNQRWIITVRPNGLEDVTVTLPAGSVRTDAGRELSNTTSATVTGPVGISVADARVEEGAGAVLAFAVTLSRAATGALSVDYATADGSARAGEDYTAASGTLSFQAGESSGTIEVGVLDDAHDEGEETLTLRLSNASGAVVTDGEATGTIENTDLMPAALLARFGRATAADDRFLTRRPLSDRSACSRKRAHDDAPARRRGHVYAAAIRSRDQSGRRHALRVRQWLYGAQPAHRF